MSKKSLKIFLAVVAVALAVLVLNSLPTTITRTTKTPIEEISGAEFYYLEGLVDLLEDDYESQLVARGVPEEEYINAGEYFTPDELYEIETKSTLAEALDETWVLATPQDLERLRKIFAFEQGYDFGEYDHTRVKPAEYVNLTDLLDAYEYTLTTVEDYDVIE